MPPFRLSGSSFRAVVRCRMNFPPDFLPASCPHFRKCHGEVISLSRLIHYCRPAAPTGRPHSQGPNARPMTAGSQLINTRRWRGRRFGLATRRKEGASLKGAVTDEQQRGRPKDRPFPIGNGDFKIKVAFASQRRCGYLRAGFQVEASPTSAAPGNRSKKTFPPQPQRGCIRCQSGRTLGLPPANKNIPVATPGNRSQKFPLILRRSRPGGSVLNHVSALCRRAIILLRNNIIARENPPAPRRAPCAEKCGFKTF